MIQKNDGWRMMPVSSYKFVIPLTVKYSPSLINHCEYAKELMEYLEFVYSGKENISRIFNVCRAFYRTEKQDWSLIDLFTEKTYEELITLLPFSPDVKVQQTQREKMAMMGFLGALPSKYDFVKAQILSSPEISSF